MNKNPNLVIDLIFGFSLFSLIPGLCYYSIHLSAIYSIIILTSFYRYFFLLNKKSTDKKSALIQEALKSFQEKPDYEKLKPTVYLYPMLSFYWMSKLYSSDFINQLDLSKLNHQEFNPDPETLKKLFIFFEHKKVSADEVDSGEFLGEFLNFHLENH